MALSVRARSVSLTWDVPFTTAETVKIDTLAASATSTIVGDVDLREVLRRPVTSALFDLRSVGSGYRLVVSKARSRSLEGSERAPDQPRPATHPALGQHSRCTLS